MSKKIGIDVPKDIRTAQKIHLESGFLTKDFTFLKKQLEGQEVIKYFGEGEKFSQCSYCGPNTGWTLL